LKVKSVEYKEKTSLRYFNNKDFLRRRNKRHAHRDMVICPTRLVKEATVGPERKIKRNQRYICWRFKNQQTVEDDAKALWTYSVRMFLKIDVET
jgi:hypothetical protein